MELGNKSVIPANPLEAKIDVLVQEYTNMYFVRCTIPEWTGMCPVTGQPDFGKIIIDYIPSDWLIESKSLKLFIASFRNYGCFHENVVNTIMDKLFKAVDPHWMRVYGVFNPRGGIPIDVVCVRPEVISDAIASVYVPPLEAFSYANR